MFEIGILSIVAVVTLYVASRKKPQSRPRLITVKSERAILQSAVEQQLYDGLTLKGFYVSCHIPCGNTRIPLALEPYRIAVIPPDISPLRQLFLTQYIRSCGWKVVTLKSTNIEAGIKQIMCQVVGKSTRTQGESSIEQKPS
ncbi:hypothetical protein [Alteribacter aurantiacus]|uniref:hypothetical protein n=1 Tax=Alteribacter aurantiacus TaxID=254410 RepID=UPI0005505CEE|nr:hypothetical protein [Alteribacter aurantiacus]